MPQKTGVFCWEKKRTMQSKALGNCLLMITLLQEVHTGGKKAWIIIAALGTDISGNHSVFWKYSKSHSTSYIARGLGCFWAEGLTRLKISSLCGSTVNNHFKFLLLQFDKSFSCVQYWCTSITFHPVNMRTSFNDPSHQLCQLFKTIWILSYSDLWRVISFSFLKMSPLRTN